MGSLLFYADLMMAFSLLLGFSGCLLYRGEGKSILSRILGSWFDSGGSCFGSAEKRYWIRGRAFLN